MFKRIKEKLTKNYFGNNIIVATGGIIETFLNDPIYVEKYTSSKYFNNHGENAKQEFRKHMMDIVLRIVNSDKPIFALRKELLESTKSEIRNRLFFADEFIEKINALYEVLNAKSGETSFSDEICGQILLWSEAECCILRMLQIGYFEKIDKENDFWKSYCEVYETNIRYLYLTGLEQIEGKEYLTSVDKVLFLNTTSLLEQMENTCLGEDKHI